MSDSETRTIVNLNVGLSEIVQAAVHQRVSFLESEKERTAKVERDASYDANRALEKVSELLWECAPPDVRELLDQLSNVANGQSDICWDETDPEATVWRIEVNGARNPRPGYVGLTGGFTFTVKAWEPDTETRAAMDEAIRLATVAKEADAEYRHICALLDDRDLRKRLEGELLSQTIATQAPEIGALLDKLSADVRNPRLIGVR